MALSNKQRQKKWLAKNRALHNLRRRQRRKNLSGGSSHDDDVSGSDGSPVVSGPTQNHPPTQTFKDETLERLRGLVKAEQEKPAIEVSTAVPARFGTYRDDGGRPITERAWNELQKKKERAEKGGYVYDEFSQA